MEKRIQTKLKLDQETSKRAKKKRVLENVSELEKAEIEEEAGVDIPQEGDTDIVSISAHHSSLQLYQLIRRCHDYITTETDSNLAGLDCTQAQYHVLRILDDLGSASMTEISKLLFRGKSNLTTLIDRMERLGLVKRIPLEGDRRVNHIVLTPKGKKVHDKVAKYHRAFILEKFKGLSEQEIKVLNYLLGKTARLLNPSGAVFNVEVSQKGD